MPVGVCLISAGLNRPGDLGNVLRWCGFDVWTPDSPGANGDGYDQAICIIIDMPGDAGFRTLQLFRDYGVRTPVLLIVDPGLEAIGRQGGRLELIPRTANSREILRWIESVCMIRQCAGTDHNKPERERLSA